MVRLLGNLFTAKVSDKSDSNRLVVVRNEPAIREGINYSLLEDVLDAKEYLFNETVELKKVEK